MSLARLELLRRGRRGDHASPHTLADLDGREPHTARGPENEERFPRSEIRAISQRVDRRAVTSDARRAHEVHAFRETKQFDRRPPSSPPSPPRLTSQDPIAHVQSLHICAERLDDTRDFAPRRERRRRA